MSHAATNTSGRRPPPQEPTSAPRAGWFPRLSSGLTGSIPTVVVFTVFSSLFYYGHQVDWTLPKFSTLVGTETLKVDDWCAAHAVPESQCVECNLDLMPKGTDYGWCQEHGVHNCPLHHPNIAQLKSTPVVSTEDLERAASALTLRERKENNSGCKIYRTRIQFASEEAVRQAGVEVELVERQPIRELIPGYGAISYDPTRLASLSSRLPGNAWRVEKNIGDSVQQGEVLVLVDAMQVGEAKTKLLQALAEENLQRQNVQRLEDARGAVAGRQVLEAEAALAKARANVLSAEQSLINLGLPADADSLRGLNEREVMDQLRFLGIPAAIQSRFGPEVATANLLPVQASIDGVVIDRMVAPGEVVDSSRALFRIADTSHMWLTLNLPLEHMDKLSLGQTVRFRPDGSRTEVHGKLDWMSTTADKQSRMVQVRAKLSNPGGRLRNETFGAGRVVLRKEPRAIVIPTAASHWEGCCQVVFVRDKQYLDSPESLKVFHLRSVRLGAVNGPFTEVLAGVLPGEVVATVGSDVLRAQLLKNNLGEGCACVAE